jgi:PEP-CTERM motif
MKLAKILALSMAVAGLAAGSVRAASAQNLIVNPGFSSGAESPPLVIFPGSTAIPDWANGADYTLWVPANTTADFTFPEEGGGSLIGLAGPGYGVDNGLTAGPDGTNYVVLDGDPSFSGTGLSQTITGLESGKTYTLSFDYAGGQEYTVTGSNTESFQVTLGDQIFTTPVLSNASQGFTGWSTFTTTFKYDGAGDLLTFLSVGTPSGGPPWALLDSPSLMAIPEPSTWAMMMLGFAGLGYAGFRSTRRKAAAIA